MGKEEKKKKGKDWRRLREERVEAEMAAAAEDERLKQEKKEAERLKEDELKKIDDANEAQNVNETHRRRESEEDVEESSAANVALNAIVRGFLARRKYRRKFSEAISANITYYGDTKRVEVEKRMALSKRRAGMAAANTFFRQYVIDLIDSRALYLVQCAAATTVQKNWRGAICRYRLNVKPPLGQGNPEHSLHSANIETCVGPKGIHAQGWVAGSLSRGGYVRLPRIPRPPTKRQQLRHKDSEGA